VKRSESEVKEDRTTQVLLATAAKGEGSWLIPKLSLTLSGVMLRMLLSSATLDP